MDKTTATHDLDDLGILRGTDKCSLDHGYLEKFRRLLDPLRHEPITLLEIGVLGGASLAMWGDYFSAAQIVGVDINPECTKYATGRCQVEIGSQADPEFLEILGHRYVPDVVIDDGSHLADHVILTFRTLWPHLRPGGIYIVEDLHFHAGSGAAYWRGASDVAPQDIFLQAARKVSCPGSEGDDERQLAGSIESMEFFYGGVAIRKRSIITPAKIAARRILVGEANDPATWVRFALHVFNTLGDLTEALDCMQRAIWAEPRNAQHYEILSIILEHASNLPDAINAARTAVELAPNDNRRAARLQALMAKSL
jgi:hypothetical protein